VCVFFFFNDTATTEIYTLSLHDALPISWASQCLHEPELTGSFRNGLRRRWWAGYLHDSWATAREAPPHRLATRGFPNGTRLRAHDRGARVAGVANAWIQLCAAHPFPF